MCFLRFSKRKGVDDSDLYYFKDKGSIKITSKLEALGRTLLYDELLTTASIKSLYCRRLHQALITLFKCGLTYIGNLFKHRHTLHGLRGEGLNLELHIFNLKFKKSSFSYLLTKL